MEQYISKSAVIAEIEKKLQDLIACKKDAFYPEERVTLRARINMCKEILSFLDTLEVKEINNVWHDARRTIPEDGSEQIICIKEDCLAVSTVGKIVNGTIKWAYLGDLLDINSFNVEVKEVDLDEEIDKIWKPRFSLGWNDKSLLSVSYKGLESIAKHFFELGIKAQKGG